MGHGIADNFLKNGYKVFVWNRTKAKAADLVSRGAILAASPKDAAQKADIVFEVTAHDESSRAIWLNDDGILAGANSSKVLITCATLSVKWTDQLSKMCSKGGFNFFDMPMTGSRAGAESGQLTLLVGGDKNKLHSLETDLKAIAKDVKYFGKAGSGMRYKLILNALQALHVAGLAESLRLARDVGLDLKEVGEALIQIPGGIVTNQSWKGYLDKSQTVNFSVAWIHKDLKYAKQMAKDINHPLLNVVVRQYQLAVDKGLATADWTTITKL